MNWEHLKSILWMRWRIRFNQIRRASKLSNVLFALIAIVASVVSIGGFAIALKLGLAELPDATPFAVLLIWTGLSGLFLFGWMMGLITDLQRSDSMSMHNLLHLPVSLSWVFLFNYISSFVSISIVLFVPAMLGLCLAMTIVMGPMMLISFPLLLAFLVMVTALTYQLRSWLARLMEDKRKGRSVVAMITFGFVLLAQMPNLINMSRSSSRQADIGALEEQIGALVRPDPSDTEAMAIYRGESLRLRAEQRERRESTRNAAEANNKSIATLGTMIIPAGWMAYGIQGAFGGRALPGFLCFLGMASIGVLSLRRAFAKTMSAVLGTEIAKKQRSSPKEKSQDSASNPNRILLVERSLPWVDEVVSAIGFANLRSILRAPEAKIVLVSPIILLAFIAVMLSNRAPTDGPSMFAPVFALGATMMGLISLTGLIQNQFGFDRAGFRALILSPVPRHDILRGKNLGIAPFALTFGFLALLGLQFFSPQDSTHFLGSLPQLGSAFLIMCLLGNISSIVFPMRLKEHGMKAANANFKTSFWQFLSVFLVPLALSPLLIPFGIEQLVKGADWADYVPVYLSLHILGLACVLLIYWKATKAQGNLMQDREQKLLDELTRS